MVTYLSQLSQMGVFKKVNGILVGNVYSKMETDNCQPDMAQLAPRICRKKDTRCENAFDRTWNGFKSDSHRASLETLFWRSE